MNLLAVCYGNEGGPVEGYHCDKLKGSTPITISPLKSNCEQLVRFDPGGNAYSDDAKIEHELGDVLGLNRQHLVDERAKLLDRIKDTIQQKAKSNPDAKIKKTDLMTILQNWQTMNGGQFEPFCQVAFSYIQKKIARLP